MSPPESSTAFASENARLRAMLAHAEDVRELEKQRLAHELHNDFGSMLTALAMRMAILSRQPPDAPPATEQWAKANAILAALTQTARRIQSELRPGALDVMGLNLALEEYLNDFGARHALGTSLALPDQELAIGETQAVALFRMFQELLSNVHQHADAEHVRAALAFDADGQALSLVVADDGVGFDAAGYDLASSHGLRRISERAAFLGGGMRIASAAGQGTSVHVTLPLAFTHSSEGTPSQ
ncbi:MAG: ATP-binding protein [Noviherbaspirillum sp.]